MFLERPGKCTYKGPGKLWKTTFIDLYVLWSCVWVSGGCVWQEWSIWRTLISHTMSWSRHWRSSKRSKMMSNTHR